MIQLHNDWHGLLAHELQQEYFKKLLKVLDQEYATQTIYPKREDILNAFAYTAYAETKVVILGQDPYHGANQAHGLSFSVQPGVKLPPSLKNIFKELEQDLGCSIPAQGHLLKWAKQGVLLLNTILTVREGEPNAHKGIGWEVWTDRVLKHLNERVQPIVFILWGKHAQAKKLLITNDHHAVLEAPHPSPLSANRGFFGSRPFSTANQFLIQTGQEPIDWDLSSSDSLELSS